MRLRDAIETIPEAFVVWDAQNRLVLCNSNFQELHNLPDEAIQAGASYESVVAAGRKPVVRSKVTSEGQIPGARTFASPEKPSVSPDFAAALRELCSAIASPH